jgi:phage baseplate assembly protein W
MAIVNVQKKSRQVDFSDLDLDFFAHPITKDVVKRKGLDAIARSIRNLVFLNFYDKPFQPEIGSNARKLLFENINVMTANMLRDAIIQVIQNYEPRADVIDVTVQADIDHNGYTAQVQFRPVNTLEPQILSLFLERIR